MKPKYRPFTATGTPSEVDAALALHMDLADLEPIVTGAHVGKLAEYAGPFAWSRVQVRGLFESEQAAREAVRAYEARWPSAGYGTSLTVREIAPTAWAVTGQRAASCD